MDMIGIFTPMELKAQIEIEGIVTLHYFAYTKEFAFNGERHDFWEFVYVDRGEVGVLAESNGYDLHQGEAIFHKPGEYHNIWAKNRYANVVVVSFVCHSPAMAFFENKIIPFGEEHSALLGKLLRAGESCFAGPLDQVHQTRLELAPDSPFGGPQVVRCYLELLLLRLVQDAADIARSARSSPEVKQQGETNIAGAVRQYLRDNVYEDITFEDVLSTVCFSKSYLTRLFREQTGSGVMEYYLGLKIAEARRLISERELSFTQIAERLHFGTIHYFSAVFKKKTGMTPTEYKHSVQSRAVL